MTTGDELRSVAAYLKAKPIEVLAGRDSIVKVLEVWADVEDEREQANARLGENAVRWIDGSRRDDLTLEQLSSFGALIRGWIAEEISRKVDDPDE